jgi:hypothetical protein
MNAIENTKGDHEQTLLPVLDRCAAALTAINIE